MLSGSVEHLGQSIQRSVRDLTSTSTTPRQLSRKDSAETELWSRMLRLAIQDSLGCAPVIPRDRMEHLRDDALLWILDDQDGPASFKWVCQLLGLSPGAVREAVMDELDRAGPDKSAGMGHRIRYWTRN